jgi:uroporphyrinogen decarboxylase
MDRRERLQAALSGGLPDRVPVSAWGHFFVEETEPQRFARAMLEFRERYDWDFLKIHSRASYHVESWGFSYAPSSDPAKGHVCTGHPIRSAADWAKLRPLPLSTPAFREQFEALAAIRAQAPADCPLVFTVFSPLDVADKLVDRDSALLKRHIDEDPAALEAALAAFAETFAAFVRELARRGVDGIYFSTKWANGVKLTAEQYRRLVTPWDLAVLRETQGMWANVLHLCEDHVQLGAMADYPVQVFHWDAQAGHNPSFAAGRTQVKAALGGGVAPATLACGTPAKIEAFARTAIAETGGRGFVLGPGCSVKIASTPEANLRALRRAAAVNP